MVWHGQGTGGVGWIPSESWCCTSGTCPSGRVTFGLGGGGRQGSRVESPCHSPFGDAGRAGSPGNGDGYGGTRDLARCWRPHENEPPAAPSVVEAHPPPQQHHAPPPCRPIFALVGVCGWVPAWNGTGAETRASRAWCVQCSQPRMRISMKHQSRSSKTVGILARSQRVE